MTGGDSMNLTTAAMIFGEVGALVAALTPIIVHMKKLAAGARCQLRSEMLRIYYHNRETEKIRQFEYENFVMLYEAYKALKGNSFIDKIYKELQTWEIIS